MSAADTETTAQEAPDAVKGGMGQMHKVHIRTGGPLGGIAKELLGEDTPENRHHLWDWNRDILPSPEAVVPSGTDLTIASPGFISGGPSLAELSRADLTTSDLKGSSIVAGSGAAVDGNKSSIGQRLARTGDATPPEGEDLSGYGTEASGSRLSEHRRAREDRMRNDGGTNSDARHTHVPEGASGAEAQADQDARRAAGGEGGEGGQGSGSGGAPSEADFQA